MAQINIQNLLNKTATPSKKGFNLDLPVLESENFVQEAVALDGSLTETLVSNLLQARLVLHICHLRVSGPGSFAKHLALGEAYELASDFADKICETVQGKTKNLITLGPIITIKVPDINKEIEYVDMLNGIVEQAIAQFDQAGDSVTANILQDLGAHLRQITYKLTFLE
jgi:DNA-binding ferritin-like protein